MAPLEGAVVASGTVVVENNVSRLQHPVGGVVGAIMVREGQRVREGDVVVRLDETSTRANLQIVVNEMNSVQARLARLRAERDGAAVVAMPAELLERAQRDADVRQAIDSESTLFNARLQTRRGQRGQYEEQIKQLNQEIIGTDAQYRSAQQQLDVAELELSDIRGLYARNLIQRPRMTQLEREVARIRGSLGELVAKTAQLRAKITETELLIIQVGRTLETEVAREIRENETKLNELIERRATADDQLRRVELKAPREGVVHQLQVHTIGGVIAPGAVVMNIVPERESLIVEARVNPQDIDQLYPDQPARVRFPAFNTRTTPELRGQVFRIAADLVKDEKTGVGYYVIGIKIEDDERARLGSLRLIPGMPAESFIKTSERTLASFLLRPLQEHMNRAFREK
jgi:HlyD family secretion protein